MTNKTIWMVLLAGVALLVMLPGVSCGGDDGDPTDIGADDARDVVDTGELCPPAANPAIPETRLRTLNVTAPEAMRNRVLQSLINTSMENEDFLWLVRFTGVGTGTITMRTGSGGKVAGTACTYRFLEPTYPAREMTMAESGLDFALSGDPIAQLDVPLWSEGTAYPEDPMLVMPLRELEINGTFSSNHLYVGSYDAVSELWTDGGDLSGKMTVADTRLVVIPDLGMTLCGLLSGDTGVASDPSDDCTRDPSTWAHAPDTDVGGLPAYAMAATFAASPVHIQD